MKTYSDKCFYNGELIDIKDLPNSVRWAEDRLSFTSLNTLNTCSFKFFNETWEDIGLSDNDSSAHGSVAHYIMSVYLCKFYLEDFDLDLFTEEALIVSETSITYDKDRAREKYYPNLTYFKESTNLLYVTQSFNFEKYRTKLKGYMELITDFLYCLPLNKIKNLYVETGIYVTTKKGSVVFGKADLIIEFIDGTYTIVDHKSSFITIFFNSMQLKVYASMLKRPIKDLIIYELSSGSIIKYDEPIEVCLREAKEFIGDGLKSFRGGEELGIGEWCSGCTVNCSSFGADSDGYVSI